MTKARKLLNIDKKRKPADRSRRQGQIKAAFILAEAMQDSCRGSDLQFQGNVADALYHIATALQRIAEENNALRLVATSHEPEIERLRAKIERWEAQSIAQYAEIKRLRATLQEIANMGTGERVRMARRALEPKP